MIDTSAAVDCSFMFYRSGSNKVFYANDDINTTVDLTSFDTSNVKSFKSMFSNSRFTNITMTTLSNEEKGLFENVASFLAGESNDNEEQSRFTLKSATNLNRMFYGCGKTIMPNPFNVGTLSIYMPTEIKFPLNEQTVGVGCDVSEMFMLARICDLDISSLNLNNAINFEKMFAFAGAINIDIKLPMKSKAEMIYNLALALDSSDEQSTINALQAFYDNQVDINSLSENLGKPHKNFIGIEIYFNNKND